MNITDPKVLSELTNFANCLGLTPKNRQIAAEYLLSSHDNESLLEGCERQTNFASLSASSLGHGFNSFIWMQSAAGMKVMDRLLRLLWAMGGASVCTMMCNTHFGRMVTDETPGFRARALGNVRAAAMEAVGIFASPYMSDKSLLWLCRTAQEHPGDIAGAMELCKGAESIGFGLLAGLLLRFAPELAPSSYQLRRAALEAVPKILFGLSGSEIQTVTDYVAAGEHSKPLPVPSSVRNPAVDARSAQWAAWQERMYLRTYGLAGLLGGHRDDTLRCMLKLSLMLNPRSIVETVMKRMPPDVVESVLPLLREEIPGGGATVLCFAMEHGVDDFGNQKLLLKHCREDIHEALLESMPDQYLRMVDSGIDPLPPELLREKLVRSFCGLRDPAERGIITAFLTEEHDLTDAPKRLGKTMPVRGSASGECMRLLRAYILSEGVDNFAVRCTALSGLLFTNAGYDNLMWLPGGKVNGALLIEILQKQVLMGLDTREVLRICGRQYEACIYQDDDREAIRKAAAALAEPGRAGAFADILREGELFLRSVAVEALDKLASEPEAKDAILSAAGDSSKQVREQVARSLPKHPEWTEDYILLLSSKKAAVRILAAEALGKLGRKDALEAALAKEKNAKAADAIRAALGAESAAPVGTVAELAASLTGGNKLKKLSWLLDDQLQQVRNAEGIADDTVRNAILLSYCELGRIGRSDTAAGLSAGLDAADLQKLAVQVYDRWFADGAQAKQKWVLPFAAVYGGVAMTQRLSKAIHDWPEHQRGAIACDAVMALALSSDPAAIVIVDSISRKFKFRQIKAAAAAALENAARELGITAEELADRIVPDLGFGKDGTRVFDYGKRSFTVRLTSNLELQITNNEGKSVKSMPAPGKTDDPRAADAYEAFKTMKKGIKTTVTAQRARLEAALSVLRCWDTERWQALFVDNPIMHQFAMSLIWGVYEDGKLTDTFRYMEDGTFNTVDEEEYTLPGNARIGLVHPVELDVDTLEGWKQQLEDYEIRQSVEQLSRTVHRPEENRAGEKSLEDFGGKQLNALSLSGKLLQQGWYRGSVQDGGAFYCFWREDRELGIGAELRFSGTAVGYDDGENVTVYDAVFYTGTVNRGSYVYDTVCEEQTVALGDVPARYYSEIVHQLTRATASSTATNENWKSERIE